MKIITQSFVSVCVAFILCMQAHAIPVALELQLMIDTSGSVDQTEFELQRDGYVAAFNNATVQAAIESFAASGGIAVSVAYFSTTATPGVPADLMGGTITQLLNPQIGWTQLLSGTDAGSFATALGNLMNTDQDPLWIQMMVARVRPISQMQFNMGLIPLMEMALKATD